MYQRYFETELKAHGYPDDLKIHYSISCCQGDGVAWYGTLNGDDLWRIAQRLYGSDPKSSAHDRFKMLRYRRELWLLLDWIRSHSDDSVRISPIGSGHYHHYNTMEVEGEHDHEEMIERLSDDGRDPEVLEFLERSDFFMKIWDDFMGDLKEDVKSLSRKLYDDGINILLNTAHATETVWSFETQHYRVVLEEVDDNEIDQALDFYDEECFIDTIKDMITDKIRMVTLRATLYDKDTDDELAQQYCSNVTIDKKMSNKRYDGVRQDLVSEIIDEYRSQVGKLKVAA